jgi:hypothetical protein
MAEAPPTPSPRASPSDRVTCGVLALAAVAIVAGAAAFAVARVTAPVPAVTVAPSPSLLVAVRELSRLEALDLHFEKVIDLTEKQSSLFGLVEATDALLLVAAVDVTMGVDLAKLREEDVRAPLDGGVARICLPESEILASRLDEAHTYVYSRSTEILARRNEALEARARKAAIAEVESAVRQSDAAERARRQAERSIRALAVELGVRDVEFACPARGP